MLSSKEASELVRKVEEELGIYEGGYEISDYLNGFARGVEQAFLILYDKLQHPIDEIILPIGYFINDVRIVHACREMGLNPDSDFAQHTSVSECQPAIARLKDRAEAMKEFIEHFSEASNPKRLEILTAMNTRAFM